MSKCADPVLCYTHHGARLFRHYSLASPIVRLNHQLVFDCGKCIFCRKKKSYELAVRCVLHASLYKQNCFLTLTYDEKKPGYHNNFDYTDIQKFKKRLRRWAEYHEQKKIQIFNVHEYGKRGKKHWHLVVFNFDLRDKVLHTTSNGLPLFTSATLGRLWPWGFHTIGSVTEASAMYQAQYTQKDRKNGNLNNDKKSHSKHSGIGRDYFLRHYDQILSLGYVPAGGKKVPIPRYFLKLAHKHWCHFNEPSAFSDLPHRKRLYREFAPGDANSDIARKYGTYLTRPNEFRETLHRDWSEFCELHAFDKEKPYFLTAAENVEYDLKNKITQEDF